MTMLEEVNKVRSKLPLGLLEAKNAIDKYGSADKVIEAFRLGEADVSQLDPYIVAMKERERFQLKAMEYKAGLQRIISSTQNPLILDIARSALQRGDNI